MTPTLAKILTAILDAAETAFPNFRFLLEYLRPYIQTSMTADPGPAVAADAAPDDVKQIVVDFLTGLLDKTSRPLLRIGLRALIAFVPTGIDLIWGQLFPSTPKPLTMASVPFDLHNEVACADEEEAGGSE